VSLFPGLHLYSIDSAATVAQFQAENKELYDVQFLSGDWKEQNFLFSFSKDFIDEAYKGFRRKGDKEYERARKIEFIFTQKCKAKLHHLGILYVEIQLPDEWSDEEKQLARNEAEFQFYHVAQTLFETIRKRERLGEIQLEKLYCYAGTDGLEGLARKLCLTLREDFEEYLNDYALLITTFRIQLGSTKFFPLTILKKSNAFRVLTGFHRVHLKKRLHLLEKRLASIVRRAMEYERIFFIVAGPTHETLEAYQRVEEGLNDVQELFSVQLGVSSTFFEVIGLTLAVVGLLAMTAQLLLAPIGLAVAAVFLVELFLLLRYSTGEAIVEQLNVLDSVVRG